MNLSEVCQDDTRREDVRAKPSLIGLDYLDVSENQLTLTVFFLGKAPDQLLRHRGEDLAQYRKRLKQSVRIEGGRRVRNINVEEVIIRQARDPRTGKLDPELDDSMDVRVDRAGDFSTYTLRLVGVENIDPFYDHLDFTFKAGCPSDLDCAPADTCPPPTLTEPEINYLAKDYASFRQIILDRLALIMPDWKERHVPDLGITLVELLAYTADYLSYYQDAVATEAYLDTARLRNSVRRHARLVDYRMHEGCNARAWVAVKTEPDLTGSSALDPKQVFFITGLNELLPVSGKIISSDDLQNVPASEYEVFEPIAEGPLELYQAHNLICFYTWGNQQCCLPRGATLATLRDRCDADQPETEEPPAQVGEYQQSTPQKQTNEPQPSPAEYEYRLHLKAGDVLIFEEIKGPKTNNEADADPTHRHAVRLTKVVYSADMLYDPPVPVVEIEWAAEDALPFPLCISAISGPANSCAYIENISVARGNVILVDHGRTEPPEDLGPVPCVTSGAECECEGHPADIQFTPGRYRPKLKKIPLTYRVPFPLPSTVARQQGRLLSTLMARVHSGVMELWAKTQGGKILDSEEFGELLKIFGSEAVGEAGQLTPDGSEWQTKDSKEQANAIEALLYHEEQWLKNKAQRVAVLQARAEAGSVLAEAAAEIADMFSPRFAEGLEPDSRYALGPASLALLQDPRVALPQIELKSTPAAPATSCEDIQPLFELKDWQEPSNLILTLRNTTDLSARILRRRFSKESLRLLDDLVDASTIPAALQEALINELDQLAQSWLPRFDLLNSQPDDTHFVVEMDNEGYAYLRFGDGDLGRAPEAAGSFFTIYRVGNGAAGNVGAESIAHLVSRGTTIDGVTVHVRNPLPATGGVDPEPMAEVKLFAPAAFRKQLQRAVTADDYAQLAQRDFMEKIQNAAGDLRWTGSWYEAQVAIDPRGSEEASPSSLANIEQRLERYRRIGHDLAVIPARYVSLDIEITICVLPHYLRDHIEAELRDVFSNRELPNGKRGFFHPDNLTFSGGIYLSQLVAAAQSITGVESARVTRLRRLYEGDHGELAQGVLKLGALEVARLDNDPSFPERGRLVVIMGGGQ